jgi:hypothetical protein
MNPFLQSKLGGITGSRRCRSASPNRRRSHLTVENLEDRVVLSTAAVIHAINPAATAPAVAVAQGVRVSPQVILSTPAATRTGQVHPALPAVQIQPALNVMVKAPAAAVSRMVDSGATVLATKSANSAVNTPPNLNQTIAVHGVLTSQGVASVVHIGAGDAADSTFDCFMGKIGNDTVTGLGGGIMAGIPGGAVGIVITGASGGLGGFGYGIIDGIINCTKPDPSGKSSGDPATPPSNPTPSGDAGTPNPTPNPTPTPAPQPPQGGSGTPNPTPNPTPTPGPQPPQPGPGDPPPGGDPNQSKDPPTTCDPKHPENGYPNPDGNGTGGPKGVASGLQTPASALAAAHSLASLASGW